VLDPARPWTVWYPLRRRGAFARLSTEEQRAIVQEHAALGRAYEEADLAHDIRLACHELDVGDNDFVIGLVGRELHPLSQVARASEGVYEEGFAQGRPTAGDAPDNDWAALPPWPTPYRLRFQDVALEAWIHASVTATDRGPLQGIAVRVDPHRRRFYRLAVQVGLLSPDHLID